MEGKDLQELRELVEFLKASGIAEFEMERPDLKVGLKFVGAAPVYAAPVAAPVVAASVPAVAAVPTTAAPAADPHEGAHIVKSPIVGTFYDAPSPGAAPFVEIGEEVSVGKVLCIIEAMKLMNDIESDAAGKVVKVFVKPGQPVEYGQPLFAVK
jgi:acetyl-CoA carboxylase biotin carboxyl carrier protein